LVQQLSVTRKTNTQLEKTDRYCASTNLLLELVLLSGALLDEGRVHFAESAKCVEYKPNDGAIPVGLGAIEQGWIENGDQRIRVLVDKRAEALVVKQVQGTLSDLEVAARHTLGELLAQRLQASREGQRQERGVRRVRDK
jgi:hypothetical protein